MKRIVLAISALFVLAAVRAKDVRVDFLSHGKPTGEFAVFQLAPGHGRAGTEVRVVSETASVNDAVVSAKAESLIVNGVSWDVAAVNPVVPQEGFRVHIARAEKVNEAQIAGVTYPVVSVSDINIVVNPSSSSKSFTVPEGVHIHLSLVE